MAIAVGHADDCPGCTQDGQREHRHKPAPTPPSTAATTAWLFGYLSAIVLTVLFVLSGNPAGYALLAGLLLVWIAAPTWHLTLHKTSRHTWCHQCSRQRYREYRDQYEDWENEQRSPHGALADEMRLYRPRQP